MSRYSNPVKGKGKKVSKHHPNIAVIGHTGGRLGMEGNMLTEWNLKIFSI